MQKYIINNTSGYLVKDIKISDLDFSYLYSKNMIIKLSQLQEKKYKCQYFLSEMGYLFLELGDYEKRFNILNKYVNLRSNMNFMNRDYLQNLDKIYPSDDKNLKYPICFYKGQIYSLESIIKKILNNNFDYHIYKIKNDYVIKKGDKVMFKIVYKSSGVYSLR